MSAKREIEVWSIAVARVGGAAIGCVLTAFLHCLPAQAAHGELTTYNMGSNRLAPCSTRSQVINCERIALDESLRAQLEDRSRKLNVAPEPLLAPVEGAPAVARLPLAIRKLEIERNKERASILFKEQQRLDVDTRVQQQLQRLEGQ